MRKSFLFVTLFCCIFFLSAVFFSFKTYRESKNFLYTHENLIIFENQLSKITDNVERRLDSIFIKKQLQEKIPVNTNFIDEQKNIENLVQTFQESINSYGCNMCHDRGDTTLKNFQNYLKKIQAISSNINMLATQYLSDSSKSQDLINEKIDFEKYTQLAQEALKRMEVSYHDTILRKATYYPIFYIVYSLLSLIIIIVIAFVLYKNFLKDFFMLTNLCKDYEEKGLLQEIKVSDFASREMRQLGETIRNTLEKLRENEQELEQQFEEIKGMNEELQSSNQQLELLASELEDTKRELERRVEEKTRQLERAYEELQDLDKMKSNFLQNISHEFKTPLTPLFGYLKLFKNKDLGELSPLQEQSIDIMLTCAEKLYNTIEDLIFLARLNLERERYMLKDIDLTYLVRSIKVRVEKELEEKRLKLSLNLPDFSIVIKGEQLMLTQTLLHLIRNAIKYTPDRGDIVIILSQEDNNAVLRIIDSGMGMPEHILKSINAYLSSADINTDLKGDFITLGLNILKRVVVFHNAKVYYKSEKDRGTEVAIIFPIKL
ncbi:MAG: hypothetical protein OHK0040_08590 [bacterium]